MGATDLDRMADRAPVLLRPARDFTRIGDDTVSVAAIDAIYFLDDIQIDKTMSINNYIMVSRHPGDAPGGKANPLIDRKNKIQQRV